MTILLDDSPTVTVEIAFTDVNAVSEFKLGPSRLGVDTALAPAASTEWTDVSTYVRGFTVKRGRTHELAEIEAGTATVTFNNRSRAFEPEFASSPFYPNVLPLRPIRISATWGTTTYRLYQGFIEEWPQDWTIRDANTTVTCSDGFERLNNNEISASIAVAALSGSHVDSLLTQANWTLGRDLKTGEVTIQPVTTDRTAALSTIQDVAKTELGYFFISGAGVATYHDQNYRRTLPVSAVFEDQASSANPYVDCKMTYSKAEIRNTITIQRSNGTPQSVTDSTSVTSFGTRSYNINTLHNVDGDAATMASQIRAAYANPHIRLESLTLRPRMKPTTLWDKALGYDIGTRITVLRNPPQGGGAISGDYFVEGVSHSYQQPANGSPKWETVWNLGPVALYSTGWVLGIDQLNVGTIPV